MRNVFSGSGFSEKSHPRMRSGKPGQTTRRGESQLATPQQQQEARGGRLGLALESAGQPWQCTLDPPRPTRRGAGFPRFSFNKKSPCTLYMRATRRMCKKRVVFNDSECIMYKL